MGNRILGRRLSDLYRASQNNLKILSEQVAEPESNRKKSPTCEVLSSYARILYHLINHSVEKTLSAKGINCKKPLASEFMHFKNERIR